MRLFFTSLAALCLFTLTSTAWADGGEPKGFMLGAALQGGHMAIEIDSVDQDSADAGAGADFQIGYGFNKNFTLYAALGVAVLDSEDGNRLLREEYALATLGLGLKIHFPLGDLAPYADVGVSALSVAQEFEDGTTLAISGGGLFLGGGLLYFIHPKLALDLGLRGTFGSFSQIDITAGNNSSNVTIRGEIDEDDSRYLFTQVRGGIVVYF